MAKGKKSTYGMDNPMSDEDWMCRADLDAIARAAAVKSDPERMKKVQKMAAKMLDDSKRRREEAQILVDLGQEGK